jgi:hypothetical protein
MSDKAERLKAELASLSLEDLDGIREYLDGLVEDEEPTQEQWDEYLLEIVDQRMADLKAGRTKLIPGEEVMERLRKKYG